MSPEEKQGALEAKLAEQTAKVSVLEKQVAKLSGEAEGLKADLAKAISAKTTATTSVGKKKEAPKAVIPETPFTVGGQKYRFGVASWVDGTTGATHVAIEALKDKKEMERIVKETPGILVKLDS